MTKPPCVVTVVLLLLEMTFGGALFAETR